MTMELARTVDTSLYPLYAIEQAIAEFADSCSVVVTPEADGRAVVLVTGDTSTTILEFWNCALDCSLVDRL
jgi:hypothetical protein